MTAGALAHLPDIGGVLHATTVSAHGRALLICGPAGSGKSSLALALMALGAGLVADDRTLIRPRPGAPPLLCRPAGLPPAIEARGLGLLAVDLAPPAPLGAVLDLSVTERERLPPHRTVRVAGYDATLIHNVDTPHFPSALMQYLRGGFARL